MTLKILLISGGKALYFCHNVRNVVMDVNLYSSGLPILLHGVISLPDTTLYDKWPYVSFVL